MPNPTELDIRAHRFLDAENALKAAKLTRDEALENLLEMTGHPEEGGSVETTDYFKITTTGRLNRKINLDAYNELSGAVDPDDALILSHALSFAPRVVLKGLKALANDRPDLHNLFCDCLETTPGKPTAKVELIHHPDLENTSQ